MQPAQTQADPKAVETFRKLGIAAMKIVYDPKISQQLLEILKAAGDPAKGIAQATSSILGQMKEKTQGANPNVVYAIAPVLAMMVAEIGEHAGLFKASQQIVQQALQIVAKQGDTPPAQSAAAPAPAQPAGLINQGVQ